MASCRVPDCALDIDPSLGSRQRFYSGAVVDRSGVCAKHKWVPARLWNTYKITLEDYAVLYDKQYGLCAICEMTCKTGRMLSVDHCHRTGAIRGLLCGPCNRALGLIGDEEKYVVRMLDYIRGSRG